MLAWIAWVGRDTEENPPGSLRYLFNQPSFMEKNYVALVRDFKARWHPFLVS